MTNSISQFQTIVNDFRDDLAGHNLEGALRTIDQIAMKMVYGVDSLWINEFIKYNEKGA